ncbi:hypothetical protein Dimus_006787 [Dionaea muscipula]
MAPRISLLSSLLSLLLLAGSSMAADVSPGSVLSASNPDQKWSSPGGKFSLGFFPITSTTYYLAVVYESKLPIWEAGGPDTFADSAATFNFLSTGNLQLVNGSGIVLWQSNTSSLGVSSASVDDSGNFVLQTNSSVSVWSTFNNPTDSIAPSQNFTTFMVLASGLYSFRLTSVGNLTLKWNNSITYWTLGLNSTVNQSLSQPSIGLQPSGILSLFDASLKTSEPMAYSSDFAEAVDFRVLKLDEDGNLKIFSSPSGNGTTLVRWMAVSDQCEVYGYCGNMGICSYNDTDDPICGCPSKNFVPIDPNDSRKGCVRTLELNNCQPDQTGMLELDNTRFFSYPPESATDSFNEGIDPCRLNCLSSQSCSASTDSGDGTGKCYQKTEDFISGYQSAALPSTSFVKICGAAEPNPPPSAVEETRKVGKLRGWIIAIAVLCTLLALLLLEGSLWWWCFRNKSPGFGTLSADQYALLEYASGAPVQFTYTDLQRATKGFKEKLGEGGFGAVYRGILANRTLAAVKQLEGIEQGEKQFRMEVATISSTHHLNLVRLIGFCSEGRHRLLVYEFMKNGSLDSFLFDNSAADEAAHEIQGGGGKGKLLLDWEQRFNIALGTARGITYLHEECRDCIVHCDIKPENILLDENYNARVSDFGLAKLINTKEQYMRYRSTLITSVRGTRGYLAPEWIANLPITSKSDVYSYGMVLLEIVSGRRNFDETNGKKFSLWAYDEVFERGNVKGVVDRRLLQQQADLQVAPVDMDQVVRAILVTFWCIQEQPSQRPTMGRVVQMLQGILEIEKPPAPKPAAAAASSSTYMSGSGDGGGLSFMASAPAASSSSSLHTSRISSYSTIMNVEMPASSSSLI